MKIVPEKDSTVDKIVNDSAELLAFLEDHRYDPAEIYDEEFLDEIKDIPDPKSDPIQIVNDFLEILHTLGNSMELPACGILQAPNHEFVSIDGNHP